MLLLILGKYNISSMAEIITFGCRLNFYESDVINSNLDNKNLKDLVIIHSCSVTHEAERQVKQAIRKVHRSEPQKKIIVIGCAVELHKKKYEEIEGVVKVLGNKEKFDYHKYLPNELAKTANTSKAKTQKPTIQKRSRAFVQIQNGCNHSCTFCAITNARGQNKSATIYDIIQQVESLLENGHKEIVLTGVDISDFGSDLPGDCNLAILIKRMLNTLPELKRLRLSSIDVAEINDDLFNLIATEKRIMPHIHISAQSGDNMILKRMKRRHNRQQVIDFCKRMHGIRPEVVFGADMIAGFPTETDEMFTNSHNMLVEAGITYLHIFPYSPRDGTAAARMPQVENNVKKERAKLLRNLGAKRTEAFYRSQIGSIHEVIIEKPYYGRAQNFALVKVNNTLNVGDVVKVKITDSDKSNNLIGEVV